MSSGTVCLIGFGELGQTLARDLTQRGHGILRAWDVLFTDSNSAPSSAAMAQGVLKGNSLRDAMNGAGVIISAVTAVQCAAVAAAASACLEPETLYVDMNSVSPGVRVEAERSVASAGGRYVEVAVMAAIGPQGIATPMLLGGAHAAAGERLLRRLGFDGIQVYSEVIGKASAAKMCRSVMVKGLEALLTESLLCARRYKVEQTVLESLSNILPGADWRELSRYMISRSLLHGRRRAEEMREVARTVQDAGLEAHMSLATAARQDASGDYADVLPSKSLESLLDTLLATPESAEVGSC